MLWSGHVEDVIWYGALANDEYFPAEHDTQEVAAAAEYVPAGHASHQVEYAPTCVCFPAGHTKQLVISKTGMWLCKSIGKRGGISGLILKKSENGSGSLTRSSRSNRDTSTALCSLFRSCKRQHRSGLRR